MLEIPSSFQCIKTGKNTGKDNKKMSAAINLHFPNMFTMSLKSVRIIKIVLRKEKHYGHKKKEIIIFINDIGNDGFYCLACRSYGGTGLK